MKNLTDRWIILGTSIPFFIPWFLSERFTKNLPDSPFLFFISISFLFFIPPFVFLFLLKNFFKLEVKYFGLTSLKTEKISKNIFIKIIIVFFIYFSTNIIFFILYKFAPTPPSEPTFFDINQGKSITKLILIYSFLGTSFFQELYFRGFLHWVIVNKSNSILIKTIYVITSSSFYSLIYIESDLTSMIGGFYMGLVTSILYLNLKNIWYLFLGNFFIHIISII